MRLSFPKCFLLLALVLTGCSADDSCDDCKVWEYALLTISTNSVIKDSVVESMTSQTFWHGPEKYGLWENGQRLTGTIQTSLEEFFNVGGVSGPGILNSLGTEGWEAYDVDVSYSSVDRESSSIDSKSSAWFLKRCAG
jgi:hypothetical protein